MLSIPGVLLFFKDLMALDISSIVKKSLFPLGTISARNAGFLDEKHDLKCSVIYSIFAVVLLINPFPFSIIIFLFS